MEKPISTIRVLHIDDNRHYRDPFKSRLEKEGMIVRDCGDGGEAAGLLPGRDFDVLVVDSSGFDYAKKARQLAESLTLIVLSTHPETAHFTADALIAKSDDAAFTKVL